MMPRRAGRRVAAALAVAVGLLGSLPVQALTFVFDYSHDTRGFFTDTTTGAPIEDRRRVLEAAGSAFSGFTDSLAAIAPGAGNTWSASITHPSLAGGPIRLTDLAVAADTLRIYVGGSSSAPGVLGFASSSFDITASGSAEFIDSVTTRGQANATGPAATDYGFWGGSIWFNARNDWYFGLDGSGLVAGRPDFLTTATHELAHLLGIGVADSWFAQIDSAGRFTGTQAIASFGGTVPLDRFQSHFAEGTRSTVNGVDQETLMDPTTISGTREHLTALDLAVLADIGWQVTAVPEVGTTTLMVAGLAAVFCAMRLSAPLGSFSRLSRTAQGRC